MSIGNVLVVGGAGYIGGCVTDELLLRRIPFTVYDNLTYENHYLKPVEFIFGDVRDRDTLRKILSRYSHVVWLAALVGDKACDIKPALARSVNQQSVAWLAGNFPGRIIFTSTCSIYGYNDQPVDETSSPNPLTLYAKTKLESEKYLESKNALILRLGTAYGIGDMFSRVRMDLVINVMTVTALKHKKLQVFGGKQWRPFVHVKDIGRIIAQNLSTAHRGIFNLATQNFPIVKLAKLIKRETGCRIELIRGHPEDSRSYQVDITKGIKEKVFSLKDKRTVLYGIREIKELALANRIKDFENIYYSNHKFHEYYK